VDISRSSRPPRSWQAAAIENTAVLSPTFETRDGAVRMLDFFPVLDQPDSIQPMREIVRIVEGISDDPATVRPLPEPPPGRASAL
jgi:hypothetical protein